MVKSTLKREEVYYRNYNVSVHSGEQFSEYGPNSRDRIAEDLAKLCIDISSGEDDSADETGEFLLYSGNALFYIQVSGKPNSFDKYEREVDIEIMPPQAKIPQEIIDLLAKRKFKKD